jgi:hypothetical protein
MKNCFVIVIVLAMSMLFLHANPPPEIWEAYRKEFPNTGQLSVVAHAKVDGASYWALYGSDRGDGGEAGSDTEAAFQVLPNGTIRRINEGKTVRPFGGYIRDPKIVSALLKDSLAREEANHGGKAQLQRAIMGWERMSLEEAKFFKANGYSLPQNLTVIDNQGKLSPASQHPELR